VPLAKRRNPQKRNVRCRNLFPFPTPLGIQRTRRRCKADAHRVGCVGEGKSDPSTNAAGDMGDRDGSNSEQNPWLPSDLSTEEAFYAGVFSALLGEDLASKNQAPGNQSEEQIADISQKLAILKEEDVLLRKAVSAVRRFREDLLGCPICTDIFKEPVTLACGHTFCRPCVAKWIKSTISCPVCRSPTLSYRSYSEALVLKELLRLLGLRSDDDVETHRMTTEQLLSSLDDQVAEEEERRAELPVNPEILEGIRRIGRVRAVGTHRHPFQQDIRRTIRERERIEEDRAALRQFLRDRVSRELIQRQQTLRNPEHQQMQQDLLGEIRERERIEEDQAALREFHRERVTRELVQRQQSLDPQKARLVQTLLDEIRRASAQYDH